FNGNDDTWYSIAIGSHQPIALAVDPVTNVLYTAQYATGDVRMIDATFNPANDHPASPSIGVWSRPFAIAVNPVADKLFGIGEDSRGHIWVIDGATLSASFPAVTPGHAVGPKGIAVTPVSHKAYAVFDGDIILIDGATHGLTYLPAATGAGA